MNFLRMLEFYFVCLMLINVGVSSTACVYLLYVVFKMGDNSCDILFQNLWILCLQLQIFQYKSQLIY